MKTTMWLAGLAAGMVAFPLVASAQAPGSADFAMKASVGNTFEVEEAKLALKQATNPKLKAFARMMIKEHTAAEKKLMTAAKSAGSPVEMKLDDPHQAMVTALAAKTGADFDTAYTADQIQAHQDTQTLLQDYQSGGDNAKLKTWAKATLPHVEMHLKKIQAIS